MADSDIQSVLAARRGRVPVLPPAPAGGYDSNTMPSDSSVYTLNNREKTGNIQHTAEEMAKIAADMQAKEAGRRQTGGADTDAEERRGAGVGVQLIESVARLHDLYKKDPTLLIPSTAEEYAAQHGAAVAPGATPQERELNARTYYLNHYEPARAEGRIQAYTSTKAALEAAAHTAGARYSPEENALNTNIYGIGPFDTPREAGLKLANWASLIERDRAQAGAGNLMLGGDKLTPEALSFLDKIKAFPDYLHNQKFLPTGDLDPEAHQLSTTQQSIPLPEGLQQEHANYLAQIPRGKLTPEMYVDLRNTLNQKYLAGKVQPLDPSNPEVQAYVKGFNDPSVHITNTIPSNIRYLDPEEQRRAAFQSSAPIVGIQHFANSITAGVPDMLAGDKAREAGRLAEEAHPVAAGAGDLAGQVAATFLGEKAIGTGLDAAVDTGHALLPQILADEAKRKIIADTAANATYGGANAATQGDSPIAGAILGGAASLGGRVLTRGAKGFMGTKTLDDLNQLKGVDLTVPQAIGAGKLEEMLRDIPVIRGARENAEGSYNLNNNQRTLALANQGLPEPQLDTSLPFGTQPGTDANAVMKDRIGAGYDQVLPNITGQRTNAFGLSMVGKESDIAQMGRKPFGFYAQNIRPIQDVLFDKDGNFTGNSYKDATGRLSTIEDQLRELQDPKVNFQGDPMTPSQATEMLGHVGDMRSHLQDLMLGQNPEEGPKLAGLDRAYARSRVIYDATNRGGANPENLYSPTQYDTSIRKFDSSPMKVSSATGSMPDQDYAEAGQRILGQSGAPSSPAFWKTLAVFGGPHALAAIAGATGHEGAGLGLETALGLPAMAALYAPGIRNVTKSLLQSGASSALDPIKVPEVGKDLISQMLAAEITRQAGGR